MELGKMLTKMTGSVYEISQSSITYGGMSMKRYCHMLMFMMMAWNVLPASAGIDRAMLIGKWCLVNQHMLNHDYSLLPKSILDVMKAKVDQQYQFIDDHTVEVSVKGKPSTSLTDKISGSKKDRIRIKQWESFSVKSVTESEIKATVLGTVKHRLTRGLCE